MGYWADNGRDVVITHSIGAGPDAKHRASSFEPDAPFQQEEIERVYTASGRIYTYLGDWHSHPQPSEQLSRRDKRTLYLIGIDRRAHASTPLMGIITKRRDWQLTLWKARIRRFPGSLVLTRLQIRSFSNS